MLKVLGCIATEHDFRLVALSGLICALGSFATVSLLSQPVDQARLRAARRVACAAVIFGSSVWSLHFVAMMAFLPAHRAAYDVKLTALSATAVVAVSALAFAVWYAPLARTLRICVAGALIGLGAAAMHYIGVAALASSVGIEFDWPYAAASLVVSVGFSIIALMRLSGMATLLRRLEVAAWLSLAICGIHFIGMAAIAILPGLVDPAAGELVGTTTLAILVGAASITMLIASLIATMVDQHISRIKHVAQHDALTGLLNRHALLERLREVLPVAAQQKSGLAVIYIDIDRFKPVNDLYGHGVGDALLIQASQRILGEIRADDTLARLGGDEFVVVLMAKPRKDHVSAIAARVVEALRKPFLIEGVRLEIGASVGIALYPCDGETADALLCAADAAMYRVKNDGRGGMRFYEQSINAELQANLQLEQELARAIDCGELVLFYQPIVSGQTGEVETFEALIRWNHPKRGLLPPMAFIPLAERSALIDTIGQWVIKTAAHDAASWPTPWRVAINVSPRQFRLSDVCEEIATALRVNALEPNRIVVEVTESILIDDATKAVATLNRLRKLGVRIALDDFGTGYSSLSYLQLFKFDKFKIDKAFVKKLGESADALTLTRTIVNLGHNLGLQVTAEGVETKEQLTVLQDLGCDQIQGYLVGRPAPIGTWTEADRVRTTTLFQATCLGDSLTARLPAVEIVL